MTVTDVFLAEAKGFVTRPRIRADGVIVSIGQYGCPIERRRTMPDFRMGGKRHNRPFRPVSFEKFGEFVTIGKSGRAFGNFLSAWGAGKLQACKRAMAGPRSPT
jgi:hypothetical protein